MHRAGIVEKREKDHTLTIKADGTDYERIWHDFRQGLFPDAVVLKDCPTRQVYVVESAGRKYVLKRDTHVSRHFEVKLWRALTGPFHSRQMRAVNRAVSQGCTVTPEIYFVAERRDRFICRESYIIMEYLPGRALNTVTADYAPYHPQLLRALKELHSHRLAFSDVTANNVMLTDSGEIKIIDLSWGGARWAGVGRDVYEFKQEYGIKVPVRGVADRLAVAYIAVKHMIRNALHD